MAYYALDNWNLFIPVAEKWENTFPVIEVDAGREIDVVITKGVRIDVPLTAAAAAGPMTSSPRTSTQEAVDDGNY